jgi:hypothetical protein
MNTIELAYQPFENVAQSTRSGGGWIWLLLGLVALAAIAYANFKNNDLRVRKDLIV